MKLNKRECNIKIRLTPFDADFVKVQMKFGDERQDFFLSNIMGDRFSSFLWAVFCLYEEEDNGHWLCFKHDKETKREFRKDGTYLTTARLFWDGEGYGYATVHLSRIGKGNTPPSPDEKDIITLKIDRWGKTYSYEMDGRDLCYALAKAYTDAMKKYGFRGYLVSNQWTDPGEQIAFGDTFLFIKAYALNALEVRNTRLKWQDPSGCAQAYASSFEKEMELLLFDM